MEKQTSLIPLLLALSLGSSTGCGELAASASAMPRRDLEAARFQKELADLSTRLRDGSARFAREEAERRAREDRARQVEIARLDREAKERAARFTVFHSAMVEYGLARLPGGTRFPAFRAKYTRHLRGVASVLFDVAGRNRDHALVTPEDDPYLLAAVAYHESSWAQTVIDGRRRGARGEIGMMQLMPNGVCTRGSSDLDAFDPIDNVQLAVNCLARIRDGYEGRDGHHDVWRWLATYASGKDWPNGRDAVDAPVVGFRAIYEDLRGLGREAYRTPGES